MLLELEISRALVVLFSVPYQPLTAGLPTLLPSDPPLYLIIDIWLVITFLVTTVVQLLPTTFVIQTREPPSSLLFEALRWEDIFVTQIAQIFTQALWTWGNHSKWYCNWNYLKFELWWFHLYTASFWWLTVCCFLWVFQGSHGGSCWEHLSWWYMTQA